MQIHLISVGNKMPGWVQQGYQTYAKRMPYECQLILKEIPAVKRSKNTNPLNIIQAEGERIVKAIPVQSHVVALDVLGKPWTTLELATALQRWMDTNRQISLIIGGPEGLSKSVSGIAHETWSLSPLTFPHPLVRVIVAEQLYRAWSILKNHPYHRD